MNFRRPRPIAPLVLLGGVVVVGAAEGSETDSLLGAAFGINEAVSVPRAWITTGRLREKDHGSHLAADAAATVALGEAQFAAVGCDKCHLPSLPGKDGPVPLCTDLLLHETLPVGVPGIEDASANQREFRTSPLWGIRLSAPYMHDGAADTLDDAIRQHAGEAAASRDLYEALSQSERDALVVFLESL